MPDGEDDIAPPIALGDYLAILWRRKVYIVLAVIVGIGAAVGLTGTKHRQYRANADVLTSLPTSAVDPSVMDTNANVLQGAAVRALALKADPSASGVTGSQSGDSAVMVVTAQAADPSAAVRGANAFANAYVTYQVDQQRAQDLAPVQTLQAQIANLQQQIDALTAQLVALPPGNPTTQLVSDRRNALVGQQLSLQSQANQAQAQASAAVVVPTVLTPAAHASATGAGRQQALGVGIGAGLLVGLALAFLFEYLDDSITTNEEAERVLGAKVPLLGTIPDMPRRRGSVTPAQVGLYEPGSPAAESYRTLRTALHFLGADASGAVVQFTAPTFGEGATTTATNLAILMARAGKAVVLVDANLRRPAIHEHFGSVTSVGLTSVMIGDASLEEALRPVRGLESLSVLPAGPSPPNPSELLASQRFQEMMADLRMRGACIVVDSPPLLPVSDGLVVALAAEAVVLVTSARRGGRRRLRRAVSQLRKAEAPLVGVVLNQSGKPVEFDGWKNVSTNEKSSHDQLAHA